MQSTIIVISLITLLFFVMPKTAKGSAPEVIVKTISYLGDNNFPRGMRNNNPGNIDQSSSKWRGKIPHGKNTDARFEQFTTYAFGVRAMIRLIRDTYIKRNGLVTVERILNKYAPGHENDTTAYIKQVENLSGFKPGKLLSPSYKNMSLLIPAMAFVENDIHAIDSDMFDYAWKLSNETV